MHACSRAGDAMQLLESTVDTVEIVFCDLQMPDTDGVEFVRYLAQLGSRGALVLVSAEDSRVLQAAETGCGSSASAGWRCR